MKHLQDNFMFSKLANYLYGYFLSVKKKIPAYCIR